jgi:hypothetical protein
MGKLYFGLPMLVLSVATVVACNDGEPADPVSSSEVALAPPPPGQGFQIHTDAFEVPAGSEEQDCYFFRVRDVAKANGLPEDAPVNLHRIQIAQREGSHHMNIFRVRTVVGLGPDGGVVQRGTNGAGECFKSSNWADWPLVANTQIDGELDWTFPDGVANVFNGPDNPDEWLMLQTHFVNASTQKTPSGEGQVKANFWTIPAAEVKEEMGTLFATKQSIRVCASNPQPTYDGSCQVNSPKGVTVIGANGHFHSRGTRFDMFAWDGTSTTPDPNSLFYTSKEWAEPPMKKSPDLNLSIPPGGGVFYTCSYQWQPPEDNVGCKALDDFDATKYKTPAENLDCCYTFGPQVDKNEHCNIFVYYYPKADNVNCF